MSSDLAQVLTQPTVDIEVAARVLGVGRSAAYRARRDGEIPSVKIGRQYRVPTAKLREMLGLTQADAAA